MPGFCANIVLTFILGVESFDYAVDRGEGGGGGKKGKGGLWPQDEGGGNQTLRMPWELLVFHLLPLVNPSLIVEM